MCQVLHLHAIMNQPQHFCEYQTERVQPIHLELTIFHIRHMANFRIQQETNIVRIALYFCLGLTPIGRFGHSSAWAFSRRVRMMMGNQLEDFRLHDEIPIRDGAYGTPWKQRNLCLAGLELPTVEYAEYLVNTTWFATCSLYYLFDKKTVLSNVERFYAEGPHTAEKHTELWHIQLILIFAFGISILAKDVGSSGPRGTEYFARAMEVIPDGHRLAMNAVTSVEVLSLVALFMQSIDMRFGAQQYVCLYRGLNGDTNSVQIDQAVRLCYSHCMHREFDPSLNTENEFEHRSKLWWTVYIIERKLCSLIGAPSALFDEDLCLELPSIDDTRDKSSLSRAFHVRISSQLGQILNGMYKCLQKSGF